MLYLVKEHDCTIAKFGDPNLTDYENYRQAVIWLAKYIVKKPGNTARIFQFEEVTLFSAEGRSAK